MCPLCGDTGRVQIRPVGGDEWQVIDCPATALAIAGAKIFHSALVAPCPT